MRRTDLLLSFLPGFAPILVYIAVEAAFGETADAALRRESAEEIARELALDDAERQFTELAR